MFWVSNFIKTRHIAILRSNLPKFLTSGQVPEFQISYLWLTTLIVKFYSIGNIFHFWDQILILVFMSHVCYLALILIFVVVTWWLLLVTARYLVVTGGYCSLLVATVCYRSLLLVLTFSVNAVNLMKHVRNNLLNKKTLCFQSLFMITTYL